MSEEQPNHPEPAELFATPDDIIDAHRIAEEELGVGFDVNYMGLPKNVGEMGDGRVYGHSIVISTSNVEALRGAMKDHESLDKTMRRICNETNAASRVFLDITADGSRFKLDQ